MDKNDVGAGYIALKIGDTLQAEDQRYVNFCWVPVPKSRIGAKIQRMHWPMRRKAVERVQGGAPGEFRKAPEAAFGVPAAMLYGDNVPAIDPGPGYRLLGKGEILKEGDECFSALHGTWFRTIYPHSMVGALLPHPYRRKISEPQEAPSPVPGSPEDMESLAALESQLPTAKILDKVERDADFLRWVADRLVHVHKDPEDVDFVLRLRALANQFPELPKPFTPNKYTRDLVALDGRKVPVDVYCVLAAFPTGSSAIDHAIKKLLAPGQRGQKSRIQDLKEARSSLDRAIQMEGG